MYSCITTVDFVDLLPRNHTVAYCGRSTMFPICYLIVLHIVSMTTFSVFVHASCTSEVNTFGGSPFFMLYMNASTTAWYKKNMHIKQHFNSFWNGALNLFISHKACWIVFICKLCKNLFQYQMSKETMTEPGFQSQASGLRLKRSYQLIYQALYWRSHK